MSDYKCYINVLELKYTTTVTIDQPDFCIEAKNSKQCYKNI